MTALAGIDVDHRELMGTALRLGRAFFGAVRYADLTEMPVDQYLELIEEANQVAKEEKTTDAQG